MILISIVIVLYRIISSFIRKKLDDFSELNIALSSRISTLSNSNSSVDQSLFGDKDYDSYQDVSGHDDSVLM
jgi:hypothetical protein